MWNEVDVWTVLIFMLLLDKEEQQELSFRQSLDRHSRRLRSGAICRGALQTPSESAFQYLFDSGQDDALVTLCGFDHQSFAAINALFDVKYRQYSPFTLDGHIRQLPLRNRRRCLLSSIQCLGLVLAWTRTQGHYSVLHLIFGITKGHLSLWLRFRRRLLIKILRNNPLAQVGMPIDDEIRQFEDAVQSKFPALGHCWGAMDGLKLCLERSGDDATQNIFFNGWTHDHYVSNLFLFSPDGKIRACYTNAPGTFHDSTMANMLGIYDKIDDLYRRLGSKVVVDLAFSADNHQSVYKSHQNNID
jgi:hypothetical protein